ncbi:MAG: alpha-N-acetylglucosaminidase [Akkermansiaceae bacterium]|nr:alpha-N-acetylglucosaminidase [Akkermansiaceae bacterium]
MKSFIHLVLTCGLLIASTSIHAEEAMQAKSAAEGVLNRLLPGRAGEFVLEEIPLENGKDVFEIDSRDGKVVIRGTNGVTICSGLNWYLKYHCKAHTSWCGEQMNIPSPLPLPSQKERHPTPYTYRYAFNHCTFGYTMTFWDWERWQKELDFMALNGINLPLAMTGAECVLREVYRKLGVSDEEIGKFISGPSYLPWFFMANLDGWGGPLPENWYQKQEALQKKILARARSLGMKPVLPAFGGHVPQAIAKKFPDAKIQRMKSWGGFPGTYILAPDDPLFKRIGALTIEETQKMFGTDHYYSAETFNEMHPPSLEPDYLKSISEAVYQSMQSADPDAVWVMYSWLFGERKLWTQPRIEALLSGVPDDNMIILDLWATADPHWTHTKAFGGKQWIWCMLHNWGGKQGMYGRMHRVGTTLPNAVKNPASRNLVGIGSGNEGGEINPVVFDQFYEMTWHDQPMDLHAWVDQYAERRYGKAPQAVKDAWHILIDEVYTCDNDAQRGPVGSFLAMRPGMGANGTNFVRAQIFYNTARVQEAFVKLLSAADTLGHMDTYRHDLVDLARQVLSDKSQQMHAQLRSAYHKKNAKAFDQAAAAYLQAIKDCDELLSSHHKFLASHWIGMARNRAGDNEQERNLYELNARNIITTWGDKNNNLHDYAQRQYGGMMGDFNYTRWKIYLDAISKALHGNGKFNGGATEAAIRNYEDKWVHSQNDYPTKAQGDPIAIARKIKAKYVTVETKGK